MNRRNEVRKTETRGKTIWCRGLQFVLLASLLAGSAPLRAQSLPDAAAREQVRQAALKSRLASSSQRCDVRGGHRQAQAGSPAWSHPPVEAAGLTVSADLAPRGRRGLRVPRRLLKQLARDKDVLSVSLDAPVASVGLVSQPVGEAEHGGYSFAARSVSKPPARPPRRMVFRQGVNGYTSAVDGGADSYSPLWGFGSSSTVYVEGFGRYPVRDAASVRQPGRHWSRADSAGLDHRLGFAAGDAAAEQCLVRPAHAASDGGPVGSKRFVVEPRRRRAPACSSTMSRRVCARRLGPGDRSGRWADVQRRRAGSHGAAAG